MTARPNTNTLAVRVANHMWTKDGKPEAHPSEPTSVGRPWYDSRASEVLQALADMGYVVRKPARPSSMLRQPLLSAADVADLLRISPRKFEQMIHDGEAPAHTLIGRQRRWRMADLQAWIDARLPQSTPSQQ